MRAYRRPKILGMLGLSLLDGDVAEPWNTLLLHICYLPDLVALGQTVWAWIGDLKILGTLGPRSLGVWA